MDLTPTPSIILSYINNAHFGATKVLCEVLDNAFDARAMAVAVDMADGVLSVRDDGIGCPDLSLMLRLGDRKQTKDSIGRYGIGLKESSIWLAPKVLIVSRHRSVLRQATVDWAGMANEGKWHCEPVEPTENEGPSFTEIQFINPYAGRLKNFKRTCRERISQLYTPALLSGKSIACNGENLNPVPLPVLEDRIEVSGEFDGRPWRMTAGVFAADRPAWKCGYYVAFGPRLIIESCSEGTGDYNFNKFFAYVEIADSPTSRWAMDRLKHGLMEQAEFLESLYQYCEPILQKAQAKASNIHLDKISQEVSEVLTMTRQEVKRVREKRGRGDSNGTAAPKDSGVQRERAEKSDPDSPGSVRSQRADRGSSVRVVMDDNIEGLSLGDVRIDQKKTTIFLNRRHPLFDCKEIDRGAMEVSALSLYVEYSMTHKGGQGTLEFHERNGAWFDQYSENLGDCLAALERAKKRQLVEA